MGREDKKAVPGERHGGRGGTMLLFFDDANKKLDDAGSNKPPHGKKKGKQDNKAKSGQRYAGYFRYRISADAGDESSDKG